MLSFIAKILIQEIIEAIGKAVANYIKYQKTKKENRAKVDKILKTKDKKARYQRMRDFLN